MINRGCALRIPGFVLVLQEEHQAGGEGVELRGTVALEHGLGGIT